MKDRFAIDSNILIYMMNSSAGKKHEEALNFLKKARNREAAIPAQCLAESYFQALKKDVETGKARELLQDLRRDPEFNVLSYGSEELEQAMKADQEFWDRLIEATARNNGYKFIYTENASDFNKIKALNPLK